jgi:peroxiredoxin
LLQGEKIDNFNLVDMDAREIDRSILDKDSVSVIFILERPCSPCDKNVIFYKKMAEMLKGKASFYGIVLNNATEALNFAEQAKLSFKVYVPKQLDTFIDNMRLRMNLAQVIVYTDKVEMIKVGQLSSQDVVQVLNKVKGLI